MGAKGRPARCVGTVAWAITASLGVAAAAAHTISGTDVATLAQLQVDHRFVTGVYELQFGELAALDERRRMDADGDGRITPDEQQAYAARRR